MLQVLLSLALFAFMSLARAAAVPGAVARGYDDGSVTNPPTPAHTIDWVLSITSPTRSILLPSVTPSYLPQPSQDAEHRAVVSRNSIIFGAIVTSAIVLLGMITFIYRWSSKGCCSSRKSSPGTPILGSPVPPRKHAEHLRQTSMDFSDGPLHEKKFSWLQPVPAAMHNSRDQQVAWQVFGVGVAPQPPAEGGPGSRVKSSTSTESDIVAIQMERPVREEEYVTAVRPEGRRGAPVYAYHPDPFASTTSLPIAEPAPDGLENYHRSYSGPVLRS